MIFVMMSCVHGWHYGYNEIVTSSMRGNTTFACFLQVGYHLDENNEWDVNIDELRRAIREGRKKYTVRGIVVINPGNPAGKVRGATSWKSVIGPRKLFFGQSEKFAALQF